MTYEQMCDRARQFIADCEITDSEEEYEASSETMYLVEDVARVKDAFIEDLENKKDFEDEADVGEFLSRHGIKWE